MNVLIIVIAILAAIFTSVGQFLFKIYSNRALRISFGSMLKSGYVISGILIYLLYFLALYYAYVIGGKISVVYPLTALAYLITPLLSRFILQEKFGWRVLAGSALIIIGCTLITWS